MERSRRSTRRATLLLCCVAVFAVATTSAQDAFGTAPHGHAAKAALNTAAVKDPLAKRDSYADLSNRDKEYWVRRVDAFWDDDLLFGGASTTTLMEVCGAAVVIFTTKPALWRGLVHSAGCVRD